MIEFLPQSEGKTVGIKISGTVTHKDYQEMIPKLENLIEKHDKINLLVEMGEPPFNRMALRALWDDVTFSFPHRNDFEKFAIVGEMPNWMEWGAKLGNKITRAEFKEFSSDQTQEAWAWLNDAPTQRLQ